ncbi:MAG: AMP-binding protein [Verrucomicrobiales bacterium]|nr:AMP-binding protein [Verrucomicrobiales bacterium]
MLDVVTPGSGSIPELLKRNCDRLGTRPALAGESGFSLSHRDLWHRVESVGEALNRAGIGRGDCVALVMPAGPELAVAFLALASATTVAPLNPAYQEGDFTFYLEDLKASALVVSAGWDSAARRAAMALGVPVLEWQGGGSGDLRIANGRDAQLATEKTGLALVDDVALVLHTSGTTSRPKIVPLTHRNLTASAAHIVETLQLAESDLCLNAMPLFHIHGLVAGVLASLAAGGCAVCSPAFDARQFLGWLERWEPSWFTAVPTMHQAILTEVQRLEAKPTRGKLRFIRSSSAALPPSVMAGLEEIFEVPVVESYGMTEAAHQMASNPLPPRVRKPGTVGLPAGPEVAILDEKGARLSHGAVGEVAIRGANVTLGYANNPDANAAAFCDGWLRTGDQGYLDADGYLTITGRLKELINRGGEKIAPREIDEQLLAHPGVSQAVAFAIPHSSLGEDIAALVVPRIGSSVSEAALRGFLLDRLPAFKVPSRILLRSDIPKGPTGKVQRITLASLLRAELHVPYEPPTTDMERRVVAIFAEVLAVESLGRNDNFFSRGGDSLRATQVLSRLQSVLGLELPVPLIFRLPFVSLFAARLEEMVAEKEINELAEAMKGLTADEQKRLLNGAS